MRRYPPADQGRYAQLAAGLLRVYILSFVAEDRVAYKDATISCCFNRQGTNVPEEMWRLSRAFKEPKGVNVVGGPSL